MTILKHGRKDYFSDMFRSRSPGNPGKDSGCPLCGQIEEFSRAELSKIIGCTIVGSTVAQECTNCGHDVLFVLYFGEKNPPPTTEYLGLKGDIPRKTDYD